MNTIHNAIAEYDPSHMFALFSGGHDSLCSTALASIHPRFTAAVHINTGIGIEETREFVRNTCEEHGWPLIEMHPDGKTYDQLVREMGMPAGPKAHNTMYYWLKQRQIRRLVREYKTGSKDRIMLVTGIRRNESERRLNAGISVPIRREGAQVWVNPILDWTAVDCRRFMEEAGYDSNPVKDRLERSGECLCGALARAEEIRDIEIWYPAAAERIHALEREAEALGHVECVWATPMRGVSRQQLRAFPILPLCVGCQAGGAA